MNTGYDIVGDVHGMRKTFHRLLQKLGYTKERGLWLHPQERVLVSVGDLIDAGSDPMGSLEDMMEMVRDGRGRMVLGNHELNALHFMNGLRDKNEKHLEQFRTTLTQIERNPGRWNRAQDFLMTCPTRLELDAGRLRVVHACWQYNGTTAADLPEFISNQQLLHDTSKTGRFHHRVEMHLKGPEERLARPRPDKFGEPRGTDRINWWEHYPADAPLVVFGHYRFAWTTRKPRITEPRLFGPGENATCVDWGVDKTTDGTTRLVALRYPEIEFAHVDRID